MRDFLGTASVVRHIFSAKTTPYLKGFMVPKRCTSPIEFGYANGFLK